MKTVKTVNESPKAEIKPRRKFDAVFKRDAVALWLNSGKSAAQVAQELGIQDNQLYLWKKTHGPHTPATQSQMENELVALRRQVVFLRQQRDILKKTLGILSEPQSNATHGSTP